MARLLSSWRGWIVVAALANAGCDDPLRPEEIVGEFPLVRFADQTPPATAYTDGGCSTRIEGGRLTLRDTGTIEITLDEFFDCSSVGGPAYPLGITYAGSYALDGSRLDIVFHANASVATTGQVRDASFSIIVEEPISPLVFAR